LLLANIHCTALLTLFGGAKVVNFYPLQNSEIAVL